MVLLRDCLILMGNNGKKNLLLLFMTHMFLKINSLGGKSHKHRAVSSTIDLLD